jgi:hypothetical protein
MARRSPTTTRTRSPRRERAANATLQPGETQALIRMYGQGLGDCFLLAFPRSRSAGETPRAGAARPVYVLVDCGVVGGTPDGPERMRAIVRDIRETTRDEDIPPDANGKPRGHLDLLIISHEHWDHLSGFVQAQQEWNEIQVDALWTAWTEKEDTSGLPAVLKRILAKQQQALAQVADRALKFGLDDQHETVLGLMSFLSDAATTGQSFAAAPSVRDAFTIAKALAPKERHVFCEPGDVHRVPGSDAVAYVLGPPRSDEWLSRLNPSRRTPETYEALTAEAAGPAAEARPRPDAAPLSGPAFSLQGMAEGRSAFNAFVMPLLGPSLASAGDSTDGAGNGTDTIPGTDDRSAEMDEYDRSFPFDRSVRIPIVVAESEAERAPEAYPALASYFDEVHHWRRIDFDWLAVAEAFALQADNLTNNTSLVVAFELPPAGEGGERKVLLFAGDAQVGNWLSWDDIHAWQPVDGAKPAQAQPDMADLLQRTAFYKVGHHGSHNATLKAKGVERMRDDGALTAFVPVSPNVARDLKDWCRMPLDALLNALSERARGRVVLPNGNVWPPAAEEEVAAARKAIGLEVASSTLPPKVRNRDGVEVEGPVPLWVQIAVAF